MLTDTKISGDRNVSNQKVFTTDTECIWKVKTGIPVIIGATGTISESYTKHLKT